VGEDRRTHVFAFCDLLRCTMLGSNHKLEKGHFKKAFVNSVSRSSPTKKERKKWYKTFPPDHIDLSEMKKSTGLRNESRVA